MTRTACLNSIYELAKRDDRVVFIGSDLSPNTLLDFKRDFPDRYYMEGIAEQNCVGLAAGLAKEGFIPYLNTIATFLTRRCYEQIAMDICLHNLPVRLIGNGGGLLYAPLGATHCAIEDIAIMRALPNMAVVNCSDPKEMKAFMPETLDWSGPMYIRLGKDSDPIIDKDKEQLGRMRCVGVNGNRKIGAKNIKIFSTGIMTHVMLRAAELLKDESFNLSVIHVPIIKPFDLQQSIIYSSFGHDIRNRLLSFIVTAEEGIINGGLGSAMLEFLADNNITIPVLRFGIPDAFPHHYGEQEDLLETYGLTPEKIAQRIKETYDKL